MAIKILSLAFLHFGKLQSNKFNKRIPKIPQIRKQMTK